LKKGSNNKKGKANIEMKDKDATKKKTAENDTQDSDDKPTASSSASSSSSEFDEVVIENVEQTTVMKLREPSFDDQASAASTVMFGRNFPTTDRLKKIVSAKPLFPSIWPLPPLDSDCIVLF